MHTIWTTWTHLIIPTRLSLDLPQQQHSALIQRQLQNNRHHRLKLIRQKRLHELDKRLWEHPLMQKRNQSEHVAWRKRGQRVRWMSEDRKCFLDITYKWSWQWLQRASVEKEGLGEALPNNSTDSIHYDYKWSASSHEQAPHVTTQGAGTFPSLHTTDQNGSLSSMGTIARMRRESRELQESSKRAAWEWTDGGIRTAVSETARRSGTMRHLDSRSPRQCLCKHRKRWPQQQPTLW